MLHNRLPGKEFIMRQSKGKTNRETTAALYVRLSRDDGLDAESNSIATQKKLLTKVAKEKGYTTLRVFEDDGISGVTMNRKGYQDMMAELDRGTIGAVFVKDLSRLGRNYIEVGRLTDIYLPDNDIRLVAVSEGYDSNDGEDDLNPIRHIFNDWYSRDISRKRRTSDRVRGQAGEPLAPPPYGYIKAPDNPKRWVIDPEAAEVVRRIYQAYVDGSGTEQIAKALTADGILAPIHYAASKGIRRPGRVNGIPHHWNSSTVVKILALQEYCGDVINFKTFSKSYKNKRREVNAPENRAVFRDVHEPIIDRAVWERIQEKRGAVRKRKKKDGIKCLFSGFIVCGDCGHNLNYHFNQKNHDIRYYNCTNYTGNRGDCPTTHYIRVDFLEKVLLGEIRRLTQFASRHETAFAQAVMGSTQQADTDQRERKRRELAAMVARDKELDKLFSRIYEDNINGKIDDGRFHKLSAQYTTEQKELAGKMQTLGVELEKQTAKAMTADMFISTVRQYTRAKRLTERMLNELVERIEVYHAEKVDGLNVQRVIIHYHCIGALEIPGTLPLPEITMNTRKGVNVTYTPYQVAT
jgi:DNA invertase Pin-like site-specific DNA recombinase